jgi:CRP-like cAMP-binding protein
MNLKEAAGMTLDAHHRPGRVSIMELDLGLTEALDAKDADLARRYAGTQLLTAPPGLWDPQELLPDACTALLVVEGLLARETTVGNAHALELFGAEDVVRPCSTDLDDGTSETWRVLQPALVAVLDEGFMNVAMRIPGLSRALLERALECSHNQSRQLAITTMPRVEDRIVALFSLLAARWGKVVPSGLRIPVALTHETLGILVGARRPTVTLAVSALREREVLLRTPDGGWEITMEQDTSADPVAA